VSEIKAFVGHSFTPNDADVVANFLTFLTQLNGVLTGFNWAHAEEAEPRELTEKVLDRLQDCNTLIAICTKKERILTTQSLRPTFVKPSEYRVDASSIKWKTSDWIIQEIGLAIGRDMSVIILLEEECRPPGGLQGNIEYIPFHRSAPEKAQGKLLEMLKALQPSVATAPAKTRAETQKEKPSVSEPLDDNSIPDASWSREKFEDAYFWSVIRKDSENAQKIDEVYLDSIHVITDEDRAEWLSNAEHWRIIFGNEGSISTLRDFSNKFPNNARIRGNLAATLANAGQPDEAANLYLEAAELSTDIKHKGQCLSSAAYNFIKYGDIQKAFIALDQLRDGGLAQEEQTIAYSVKHVGNAGNEPHLEIEAMEALARLRPDDYDNRFSLAYAHSQEGNEDMALHHYLAIPSAQRSGATWNNLGVSYQDFLLSGKAVSAYQQAAEEGETLAMSNLAYKLMNAGFLKEASTELKKAMSLENPNKNVGAAYSTLSDIPDNEDKKVKDALDKMKPKIDFYRRLSRAILTKNITQLPHRWTCPNGNLSVDLSEGKFHARCEYKVEGNALSGLLGGATVSEYRLEMNGAVCGSRVYGKIKRKKLSGPTSFLGSDDEERPFALIFADDLNSADVMENLTSKSPNYFKIEAATVASAESNGEA